LTRTVEAFHLRVEQLNHSLLQTTTTTTTEINWSKNNSKIYFFVKVINR
jgi:hypothetical protein